MSLEHLSTFDPSIATTHLEPWRQYKRPFIRDLAFALFSPDALNYWPLAQQVDASGDTVAKPILVHDSAFWQNQYEQYSQRLRELDSTNGYQDLTRYLMARPSPYRLGFHFEGLLQFWLEDGYHLGRHPYEVLAHNQQLFDGAQTTGELDFILYNHDTNEVEHWELAIKFYVGFSPYHLKNWVGINRKDNLERKLTHMKEKPFRSIEVNIDFHQDMHIDKRYAVLKGRFFRPASHTQFVKPEWLNAGFALHKWYGLSSYNSDSSNEDGLDNEEYDEGTICEAEHNIEQTVAKKQLYADTQALKKMLTLPQLRPTHYIEKFTNRPFYNASFIQQHNAFGSSFIDDSQRFKGLTCDKEKKSEAKLRSQWPYRPLRIQELRTGVYINENEPLVILDNTYNNEDDT